MVMIDNRQSKTLAGEKRVRSVPFALLGVVALLIILILATRPPEGFLGSYSILSSSTSMPKFELGKTTTQEIEYYHCPMANTKSASLAAAAAATAKDLVLLHGSAFTKENWKTCGIMDQFCSAAAEKGGVITSVTALDLDVLASFDDLLAALQDLAQAGKLHLPVAAVVTPSASGHAIIQAITTTGPDNISRLKSAIQRWIPVACNAILKLKVTDGFGTEEIKSWPILAIYGDQDAAGKQTAEFLNTQSGAVVQELKGRHPVYLDSPNEFVQRVLAFLK